MANFRYLDDSIDKFKQLNKIIKSGFDVTSVVAEDLDLGDDSVKEMRDIMLKYAAMERDLKNYVKATEESRKVFERFLTNVVSFFFISSIYTLFGEILAHLAQNGKTHQIKSGPNFFFIFFLLR